MASGNLNTTSDDTKPNIGKKESGAFLPSDEHIPCVMSSVAASTQAAEARRLVPTSQVPPPLKHRTTSPFGSPVFRAASSIH